MILKCRPKYTKLLECETFCIDKIILISFIVFCRWGNKDDILCIANIVSNLPPLKLGNAKYFQNENITCVINPHYKNIPWMQWTFCFEILVLFFLISVEKQYLSISLKTWILLGFCIIVISLFVVTTLLSFIMYAKWAIYVASIKRSSY